MTGTSMGLTCFFSTDLHGSIARYESLFSVVADRQPDALFLGGDLLPHRLASMRSSGSAESGDFVTEFLMKGFRKLKFELGDRYPRVFCILGNDDGKPPEQQFLAAQEEGLWSYMHERRAEWRGYLIFGYSYVPPTPFHFKDWERYDVSRYVDPGCISPEEGIHTAADPPSVLKYSTISQDLETLTGGHAIGRAIMLFHAPPYRSCLDRAALDGKTIDHVPLDVHVGSIAVQRFIAEKQPLITLHGHIHESVRITGSWKEQSGSTWSFGGAHDGPELAVVSFDPERPEDAERLLL